ncbi:ribose 5-phosphate isomerase B [Strigomonas culicis]|uniref:Ribose 5-phosphate isomerase B n=1 Tax=Strigomonas culicis TaxID=28005 RepID=S9V0Y3_9TRYP|nr:ribose 5-phosphate isomerase B [Strigomonas culicis]|eukprot:EPY34653.1 ribose 5-phosphate isomerase B [Strigomonas culicis]
MPRVVAFSCDHAAYHIKDTIVDLIKGVSADIEVLYLGPQNAGSVDYPDYAQVLCEAVTSGRAEVGVLLCGTGIGMSIAANKVPGIRAALCHERLTAQLARLHNNANVVCAGERIVGLEVIRDIITTFLTTEFTNEARHEKRIAKIHQLEPHA